METLIISGNIPVGDCCICDCCDDKGNLVKHVDHYILYRCDNCGGLCCKEHREPCGLCTGCCTEGHGLDSH